MKKLTEAMRNGLMYARKRDDGNYYLGRVDSRTRNALSDRGLVIGTRLNDAGMTERAMLMKGY